VAGLPVALLVAEACNIGLTPLTNSNHVELTRTRLWHVDQNYLRGDTIAAANALLIEAQAQIPLARCDVALPEWETGRVDGRPIGVDPLFA
jgi:hypothetical protein